MLKKSQYLHHRRPKSAAPPWHLPGQTLPPLTGQDHAAYAQAEPQLSVFLYLSPQLRLPFLKHSNTLLLLLRTLSVVKTMSTIASSLVLPSLTPKATFLCNPKPTSVSLFSLSLSSLRLHCKPISVSTSWVIFLSVWTVLSSPVCSKALEMSKWSRY
jgi:hypothetical protein